VTDYFCRQFQAETVYADIFKATFTLAEGEIFRMEINPVQFYTRITFNADIKRYLIGYKVVIPILADKFTIRRKARDLPGG